MASSLLVPERRAVRKDAWWDGRPQIRITRWMPHEPTIKQHAFLWLQQDDEPDEALYGGAAGGGKSDALLLAALQYVDVPGYAAILFRRTLTDLALEGALIPRSKEWLSHTDAVWHEQKKQWSFPSGATIQFAYLKDADSKYRYQGAEFQFIGFDELTQFPEEDYTYLFSRLRRPLIEDWMPESLQEQKRQLAKVPLRMRGASNPGGRGHRWVKRRFIDVATRGKRIFIPARLDDNPYIDKRAYEVSLEQLDHQTRLQLRHGDWTARGPGHWMLSHEHLDACFILGEKFDRLLEQKKLPPPTRGRMNGGIDWGEVTQAYAMWELERGGVYIPPSEVVSAHNEPGDVTMRILSKWMSFGFPIHEARYDAAGVQSMRTFVKTARAVPGLEKMRSMKIPFGEYKVETIKYMRFLAERSFEAQGERIVPTQILAISPKNLVYEEQIYEWERKNEETDEAVKENDHGPDASVAGIAPIAKRHRERVAESVRQAKEQREEVAA
jgi:hypothetical protein